MAASEDFEPCVDCGGTFYRGDLDSEGRREDCRAEPGEEEDL